MMPMRVISGSARGRQLKLVPGQTTRPIMDKVKEALFSIIGRRIVQATFLDLYAGTGSVGIEALSRGAGQAIFVERDQAAVQTIQANLEITGLGGRAIIRRTDVLTFLTRPPQTRQPFDYIYIAPPQYKSLWLDTIKLLDRTPAWLGENTTVIVQIDPAELRGHDAAFQHLQSFDQRTYGNTLLWFLEKMPVHSEPDETDTRDE